MFHICFAADENYIKYTAVLITSIIKSTDTSRKFKDFFAQNSAAQSVAGGGDFENSKQPSKPLNNGLSAYKKLDYTALSDDEKSEGYIFHILTDKITENSRKKLEKLAQNLSEIYPCEILVHICNDTIFQGLPKLNGNYLAYFRLFIPNFMPRDLKMCLYLDTDMLALQDLRGLFALDLSDKVLAAVMDKVEAIKAAYKCKVIESIEGLHDGGFYFNSGFLLMNLREWQRQDTQKQCFDFLRDFKPLWHDQDALNYAISRDKVLLLPPQYNSFTEYYYDTYKKGNGYTRAQNIFALIHPVILHFCFKPWLADSALQNEGFEWHSKLFWLDIAVQTPFYRDFEPLLQSYKKARTEARIKKEKMVQIEKDEFTRLKNLEHFGGFVKFYTHKQFLVKPKNFLAKIRRKTRFIRYPIKRFFGFGGERV